MSFVPRKVEDGVTDHHVCEAMGEIHLFDRAYAKVARRQVRCKLRRQGSDVCHALWTRVYGKDFAAFAEQMDQVSSVAAASVEDTHAGSDVSSQDLIEDVDIDLAELILHVHRDFSCFHLSSTGSSSGCLPG